ncbi:RNA polymerase sigma-70 factor (ECF subfamily) [Chitinophaga skermanii]|uniref:RNA polymerase sigma-70 factor (ECF subfamily) n=1 Tax=Chitinophaga skermanii TaxID=331697 RepID=A0A327QD50_9BACT|nr:RNA polymerase sigma-70 factor [Chitinophaga skermanii]RAJ02586.1 RNA polymerase sigma-70 factor (ECF subfamily) [Chitinophaga skermanii]
MYNSYSDEQLLLLLKDDNVEAFNAIYARYSRPIYLYILSKLDTTDQAQDVLQDVFTSVWEKRKVRHVEALKAYLYQSVRHKIIDQYRKDATYRKYLQQLIEHFDAHPNIIMDQYDMKAKAQEVLEAINQLPGRMKEIFMLSRFENLSIDQIATKLDLSPQTVKNQITKALKILRTHYSQSDMLTVIFFVILYRQGL